MTKDDGDGRAWGWGPHAPEEPGVGAPGGQEDMAPGATSRGRVKDKVALVTGAGQVDGPGIGTGRATSILLARHGASVVLVDRELSRAEATRKEIEKTGGTATTVQGDVTNRADCERMTQAALDSFGRLDVAVNNVGVSVPGNVVDTSEETWDELIDINLKSVFLVSKYALPAMVSSGGGSIINVSSVGALRSIGFAAYSAAKGGMISLSQEMAAQHGPEGIRVNVVVPGNIQTPRTKSATRRLGTDVEAMARRAEQVLPLGRSTHGSGWDIGYAALFLASNESSWITGQVLVADGGANVTTPVVALASLELTGPNSEDSRR